MGAIHGASAMLKLLIPPPSLVSTFASSGSDESGAAVAEAVAVVVSGHATSSRRTRNHAHITSAARADDAWKKREVIFVAYQLRNAVAKR